MTEPTIKLDGIDYVNKALIFRIELDGKTGSCAIDLQLIAANLEHDLQAFIRAECQAVVDTL